MSLFKMYLTLSLLELTMLMMVYYMLYKSITSKPLLHFRHSWDNKNTWWLGWVYPNIVELDMISWIQMIEWTKNIKCIIHQNYCWHTIRNIWQYLLVQLLLSCRRTDWRNHLRKERDPKDIISPTIKSLTKWVKECKPHLKLLTYLFQRPTLTIWEFLELTKYMSLTYLRLVGNLRSWHSKCLQNQKLQWSFLGYHQCQISW